MTESVLREDTEDQFNWNYIQTFFDDAGQITERATEFDDGFFKRELFEDGVRSQMFQYDFIDATSVTGPNPWYWIETYFDGNGRKAERGTTYDNGVFKLELFDGDVRSQTTQTDGDGEVGDPVSKHGHQSIPTMTRKV